jgi:signal transduction histidine kinase
VSNALEAFSRAVLAIAGELSLDEVLQRLVDTARELAHARYAALGIPDGAGGFAQFITSGMSDKQWDAIGELPRQHGLLGAMLETAEPYRVPDIKEDPRYEGWPATHPNMASFLGVPIVSKGTVIAAFYLTDRRGGARAFTDDDQSLIETLAAHAAIAIENARLYERSRELSVVEERNRLARDLHDSVTQTLFSLSLTAESAAAVADTSPARAKEHLQVVQELAGRAMQELRSLVFELRPAELESDGLVATLRKHVDVVERVYRTPIELEVSSERRLDPTTEKEIFRVVQEALTNALKHSQTDRLRIEIGGRDGAVSYAIRDFGSGFDPEEARQRSRRLGLTSMRERAEALGGSLVIDSAPGRGTTVTLEVDVDRRRTRSRR